MNLLSTLDYPLPDLGRGQFSMTARARAYLAVVAARNFALAVALFWVGNAFVAEAFTPIKQVAQLGIWAWFMVVIGIAGMYSCITGREWVARLVLIASCVITSIWAAALVVSGLLGELQTPLLPITWCAMLLKDLIAAAIPLRSPFEDFLDLSRWQTHETR